MNIAYLDSSKLMITAPELVGITPTSDTVTNITVIGTLNCGTSLSQEVDIASIGDINANFYMADNILYLSPFFFGLGAFQDSIVKVSVKIILASGGYTLISNCAFVDITFKCKVAGLLQN